MTSLDHHHASSVLEAPSHPAAMTLSADDPDAQKRLCIAGLMDRHPETFAAPTSAPTWTEFVERQCVPQDHELATLNLAIGRLVQVMRVAQSSIPDVGDLPSLLQRAQQEGVGDLEPDAAVESLASPDAAPEDVQVMARAMSLYKTCVANGAAQGDEITNAIDAGFALVPVTSAFMQSLVDTAKEVTLIDIRHALGLNA
ncbi:hypothetical protein [Roseateles depolymerans]|uniref:Uncharacterized protein n=1 Tax=Roseateles depolymerans TaxID=76731 RepID=A0A0U3MLF0_9BURK|nr:hypothetical protein [Roseateles depolymerans]ALV08284.1 hypothetical protein RD2015_3833 [Roseateles depolymerans]REG21492.1 hypothetical protein DES44_0611 [Roseateles depolymerans]